MSNNKITDLSSFRRVKGVTGNNPLINVLWYSCNFIFFTSRLFPFGKLKVFILRLFGASVGAGVVIKPGVNIKYPWKLRVGDNVWVGENVWIDNLGEVRIDSNVCISQGALLLTGNHNYNVSSFDLIVGMIKIEEGAWIGAKSIVCPNVKVGNHAVLTVGSVATHDLEPYTIYQGNPAVMKKKRTIR